MGSIAEVKEQLEATKALIAIAPYEDASKAFNGLEIIEAEKLKAQLGALVSNMEEHVGDPGVVRSIADGADMELCSVVESDENIHPDLDAAFGHLDAMKDKAEAAHGHAVVMQGLGERALGLYVDLMSVMGEFEANRVQGADKLNESAQSGVQAVASINKYEASL
jgi:hypothetical protein